MVKLVKFTENVNLMYPSGRLATAEDIRAKYPAVGSFAHVLTVQGNVLQAIEELVSMRERMGVEKSLGEAEAIAAMEEMLNTPAEAEVSAEERIAAALEFQNLLSL